MEVSDYARADLKCWKGEEEEPAAAPERTWLYYKITWIMGKIIDG
jgi:hypothetical protein